MTEWPQRIDYAGWSVDIFDDPKVEKLLDEFGWKGFGIYFYLCQRAYGSDGYFYRWGFDAAAATARKMGGGITSSLASEVVAACFRIGLFDRALYEMYGILTSRGIQKRWYIAVQSRQDKFVIDEFWLLENEDSKGVFRIPKNADTPVENGTEQPELNKYMYLDNIYNSLRESESKSKNKNNYTSSHQSDKPTGATGRKITHKTFEHGSDPYKAARYLSRKICERLPSVKPADENRLQSWAMHIERIHRLDGFDWDTIADVLEFSQKDPFWQKNILSGKTFREKFIQLLAKMGGDKR